MLENIMFKIIKDISDPLLVYIKDDPVRPEIPTEFRITGNRFVATLVEERPTAIVCVSLNNSVPTTVQELDGDCEAPDTAIFYTIWSYASGAAAKLLFDTVAAIQQTYPSVTRFVTLSPKTEMAYRFHMRNGASVLRENEDTVNYEYFIPGRSHDQVC